MKDFEVTFKWNANTKLRRWTVRAASEQYARLVAEATLRRASATARIIDVSESGRQKGNVAPTGRGGTV